MKQTLLAVAVAVGLTASPAIAQQLGRRPQSNLTLLNATAKLAREESGMVVVPAVAAAPVEEAPAFNGESSKIFATKVHPILMNACATCHARSDYSGSYKLKRVDDGYANAVGIERNLMATVKQLDRANPGASPFLLKAITAHGKAKDAPLHSANHPAYKYLEVWAYWASMPEGSPMPTTIPIAVAKKPEPVKPAELPKQVTAVKAEEPAKLLALTAPAPKDFAAEVKTTPPVGKANPDDPFDPAAFNRVAYPMRK